MTGLVHRLRVKDNINTDNIIPCRYEFEECDEKELATHIFEDIEPEFAQKIKPGDFLVAGNNFGCGSSRESALDVLKNSGLRAIIANSYGRIFYRNAFNVGFCLIECETQFIDDMDEIELDLEKNIIRNLTKGINIKTKPISGIMNDFLRLGGVIEYYKEKKWIDVQPGN